MKTKLYFFLILFFVQYANLVAQSNSNFSISKTANSFGEKDEHLGNFTGKIYYLPENSIRLPDFTKLTPVGEIFTNSINVQDQDFTIGFPGVTNRFENFAIDYKGEFYLKDSNYYSFQLCSDDGSKLYIDNNLIIDNDFQHSVLCKINYAKLKQGIHSIEVQYFQGPRERVALTLRFKRTDEKEYQIFNLSNLYPISVEENNDTIHISIGDEILFDFNSYELNDIAKKALSEIKRIIIDKSKFRSIIVEGYTDDIGSEQYNLKLSLNRANSVKLYFTKIGVDSQYLITKGCGFANPKVPNIDDESRRKNRRIEMAIIKLK